MFHCRLIKPDLFNWLNYRFNKYSPDVYFILVMCWSHGWMQVMFSLMVLLCPLQKYYEHNYVKLSYVIRIYRHPLFFFWEIFYPLLHVIIWKGLTWQVTSSSVRLVNSITKELRNEFHKPQEYWKHTWLLTLELVELVEVRVSWFGHLR